MKNLAQLISAYVELETHEIEALDNVLEKKSLQKNEMILTEGIISHEIYLVIKGCVRLYYNVDGNHKTAFFYTEGQFICAGESYTFNVPAKENYQAIEDTEIYVFSRECVERLLAISNKFEILGRIATENELIACQKMIASFVTKSAEERYVELLDTQGELFQRVPQQYIASYLGVSPETLSRIKTRAFQKQKS
jgi:CRP-like cAMP-binding protein